MVLDMELSPAKFCLSTFVATIVCAVPVLTTAALLVGNGPWLTLVPAVTLPLPLYLARRPNYLIVASGVSAAITHQLVNRRFGALEAAVVAVGLVLLALGVSWFHEDRSDPFEAAEPYLG